MRVALRLLVALTRLVGAAVALWCGGILVYYATAYDGADHGGAGFAMLGVLAGAGLVGVSFVVPRLARARPRWLRAGTAVGLGTAGLLCAYYPAAWLADPGALPFAVAAVLGVLAAGFLAAAWSLLRP